MDEKDLEKKKSYGEQYQELLEEGHLLVKEAEPAESYSIEEEIKRMAYQEFLQLRKNGERVEFIGGKIYYMASPSVRHQELLGRLHERFSSYLHGKKCKVFIASVDVKIDFIAGGNAHVVPDLIVVCDKDKLDEKGLNGAPELALEILSPSNRSHDLVKKYNQYLEVGVREYWIVDPEKEEVTVNLLSENKKYYVAHKYAEGDKIKVFILENLIINVTDLFEGYKGAEPVEIEQRISGIAKRLLELGLPMESFAQSSGISITEVKRLLEQFED